MGCKFPSIQGYLHLMGFTITNYNSGAKVTAVLDESLKVPLRILLRCLKSDDMNTLPLSV